jgi:hypothetical protein
MRTANGSYFVSYGCGRAESQCADGKPKGCFEGAWRPVLDAACECSACGMNQFVSHGSVDGVILCFSALTCSIPVLRYTKGLDFLEAAQQTVTDLGQLHCTASPQQTRMTQQEHIGMGVTPKDKDLYLAHSQSVRLTS